MKNPKLKVIEESDTGLNKKFVNTATGEVMTRGQVADRIDEFPNYHVMNINRKRVIRSNPNGRECDNLG